MVDSGNDFGGEDVVANLLVEGLDVMVNFLVSLSLPVIVNL